MMWRDRCGFWRALRILTYLPIFREDLAQMLCAITHIWSLTFVEPCLCVTARLRLSVADHIWQSGDSSEVK